MRLGGLVWRLLATLLFALIASRPAYAREVAIQTCVAPLAAGQSAADFPTNARDFVCDQSQNALGGGDFVSELRFAPVRSDATNPLVLRMTSIWQDAQTIRFHYADGSKSVLAVNAQQASQYLTLGAIWEFKVPARPAALSSIRIVTRGSANLRGIVVDATLVTREAANGLNKVFVAIYAAFAGLAVALLIYNFSLWRALRNRFQLYYCAMVCAISAYAFSSSGALALAAPWIANNDRLRINYVLLALCAVTGIRFVRNFFEREVSDAWLVNSIRRFCIATLLASLAFAILSPWQIAVFDRLYFVTISALVLLVFPLITLAGARRARNFGLFMLAWAAPIAIAVLRSAAGFDLVPYSVWLDNGTLIAMAIEAALSSMLVTIRVRAIIGERDHARSEERSARMLAGTDPLTGLFNRRSFLDQAIGLRSRQQLLLIDIDHFKKVNDRLGHEAGDQVLVAVAEAIERCRPERSVAVRLGGEEFGILLPRKLASTCRADDVLTAVREAVMPQGITVTASIGISEGTLASETDWKRLYRLADAALYRAKADGRDRACKATDFRDAA